MDSKHEVNEAPSRPAWMESINQCNVPLCRELLSNDDVQLNKEFDPWYGVNVESKIDVIEYGVWALAVDIVRKNSPVHAKAIQTAWKMFKEMIPQFDVDDARELKLVNAFADLGGIELTLREYERARTAGETAHADALMLTFGWLATEYATPKVIAAGIHKLAVDIINQGPDGNADQFDSAMSMLRAASAYVPTRKQLRAEGAIEAVLPYVDLLKSDDAEGASLRHGFRAASVVARLAGNDEQGGVGVQIFREHPVMITKVLEVLTRVLDAGPKKSVLRMHIDPHLITMDLLIISTSDANKPLLKSAIPVLIRALELRGDANKELVDDIVAILLQLSFEPQCLSALVGEGEKITGLLQRIVTPPRFSKDTLLASLNLQNALKSGGSAASKTGGEVNTGSAERAKRLATTSSKAPKSKLEGLIRRVLKDDSSKKASLASPAPAPAVATPASSAPRPVQKHIMLSYNWDIKPIVKRVDELLVENGFKTWIDDRDMGSNLTDSMASAIESASCVFVFMTAKYKESANCRKECEYADDQKVPIVYIMAEENYKPNGWLGLQLGRSVWTAGWSIALLEQNCTQLMEKAKSFKPLPNTSIIQSSTTTSSSSEKTTTKTAEAMTMAQMQKQMETMQAMMVKMQERLDSLAEALNQVKQSKQ